MQAAPQIRGGVLTPSLHVRTSRKTVRRARHRAQAAPREEGGDVANDKKDYCDIKKDVVGQGALLRHDRRSIILAAAAGGAAMGAVSTPAPAFAASPTLSERLERKDFCKPVFNKARPGPQEYPEWLEGTWNATTSFQGE